MPRCPLKMRITPLLPFYTKESPGRLEAALGLVTACAEPQRCGGSCDPAAFGVFLSARAPGRAGCASGPRLMRCDSKCRCKWQWLWGGVAALPWLHGDVWGEGGGLIAESRVHLPLCQPIRQAGLSREGLSRAESQRGQGQAATDGPSPARGTGVQPLPGLPKSWFGVRARNDPGQGVLILPLVPVTLLGCPVAIARATVTGHSLPGVRHLRDGPMPSTGDGAQVGALLLLSPVASGHHGTQKSPKSGDITQLRASGLSWVLFYPSAQPHQGAPQLSTGWLCPASVCP